MTIDQLVNLVDVFTIGGTKNGALFGEAIVFTNRKYNLADNFRWTLKQRGGMLAKGRLLGLQFNTLFTNNLFLKRQNMLIRWQIYYVTVLQKEMLNFGQKQKQIRYLL